jgi:Transposase DDE domain group 1
MAHPTAESIDGSLTLDFDRRLKVEFHDSRITFDAGLLAYHELDGALGLSAMASDQLADARTGRNARHAHVGLLRQSVFGRLASYEDVNDALSLARSIPTVLAPILDVSSVRRSLHASTLAPRCQDQREGGDPRP